MTLLSWSREFAIGIGIFDQQHREIVDEINEVQAAVEGGMEQSVTGPLLTRLAGDTMAHFKAEEAMMAAANYPGLMLHGMKHQRLLEQLKAFLARYSRENSVMDRHSLNFLRDWATTHIQSEDMNFGLWLNEHGKH
jgi:hemerythrin-like metal-binding protein